MPEIEDQIAQYLMPFPAPLAELAQMLRGFFRTEGNPKYELVGDSTISVNIGYGFTTKAWDCYCAIIVYSKHINLSFPSGAYLEDPEGMLQGTGTRVRNVRLKSYDDLNNPALLDLIQKARTQAIDDAEMDESPMETETIIKEIGGPKKRPIQS